MYSAQFGAIVASASPGLHPSSRRVCDRRLTPVATSPRDHSRPDGSTIATMSGRSDAKWLKRTLAVDPDLSIELRGGAGNTTRASPRGASVAEQSVGASMRLEIPV